MSIEKIEEIEGFGLRSIRAEGSPMWKEYKKKIQIGKNIYEIYASDLNQEFTSQIKKLSIFDFFRCKICKNFCIEVFKLNRFL